MYSARIGLEIGADIVKLKYSGNLKALKKAVAAAGRCKIVVAGGIKVEEKDFLKQCKEIVETGVLGMAVGRNIWKSKNPEKLSKETRKIIFY